MNKGYWLAAAGLVLGLAGCNAPSSPVGGKDEIDVESANEIDANTAVSVYGPEGNASNAAAAALPAANGEAPDYNVAALDARPESERGNLGGRPGN